VRGGAFAPCPCCLNSASSLSESDSLDDEEEADEDVVEEPEEGGKDVILSIRPTIFCLAIRTKRQTITKENHRYKIDVSTFCHRNQRNLKHFGARSFLHCWELGILSFLLNSSF
jgi:hypothetical protein